MRLIGILLLVLAGASLVLPWARPVLPFRLPLADWDALHAAIVIGVAGLVAVVGSRG